MENKLSLETQDFQNQGRSLNFDGMKPMELEKSYTEDEFNESFGKGEHAVFSQFQIAKFIKDANTKVQETLQKSESTDDLMKSVRDELGKLSHVKVKDDFGHVANFYVAKKDVFAAPVEADLSKSQEADLGKGEGSDEAGKK